MADDQPTRPNPDENAPPEPESEAPAPGGEAQADADEAKRQNLTAGDDASGAPATTSPVTPTAPPPASPPIEGTPAEETAAAEAVPEPTESALSERVVAQQTQPDEDAAKDITRPTAAENSAAGCLVALLPLLLMLVALGFLAAV